MAAHHVGSHSAEQPNILFIFADDCGIDCFGCYGSDRARSLTPNIDALARSGARFERCYSTPLCGPSRCLLMTGRYGFRTDGLTIQTAGKPSFRDVRTALRVKAVSASKVDHLYPPDKAAGAPPGRR